MTKLAVIRAYRRLYRAALEAVHYSSPARQQIRAIIRPAFRTSKPTDFIARRVDNTENFLRRAAQYNGTEHKILRSILHSRYWSTSTSDSERWPEWITTNDDVGAQIRKNRYEHLHATVVMLNESMDLCLRSR